MSPVSIPPDFSALPGELAELLEGYLRSTVAAGALTDGSVAELRDTIGRRCVPDYERHAASFAYSYFTANYAKMAAVVWGSVRTGDPLLASVRDIYLWDLGCGSGASTVGAAAALIRFSMLADIAIRIRVRVCDVARPQLTAFARVSCAWLLRQPAVTSVETCCSDVFEHIASTTLPKDALVFVVSGYLLCELDQRGRGKLLSRLHELRPRGSIRFMIVDADDEEGSVIRDIHGETARFAYPSRGLDVRQLQSIGLSAPPKFGPGRLSEALKSSATRKQPRNQ